MKVRDCIVRGAVLAIVLSAAWALPAMAQTPAAPARALKVAVINGDRVLAESNIGNQVSADAQAAAAGWDNSIRAKQTEIDTLVAQAQEQRLTLTEDALARIQASIEQLNVEMQRLREDAQAAMNRMADDAQTRINAVLIPAVELLANAEGYDLILDTRIQGILYFADAIDATDRYIAMVNASIQAPQQDSQQQ